MWQFILLATILILPLTGAYPNFGYQQAVAFGYQQAVIFGYEQSKVLLFIFLITIAAFLYLWKFKIRQVKFSAIDKAGLIFLGVLFLTSFLGVDQKTSFLGNFPYFQGWIFYAYLYLFYLLVKFSKISFAKWAIVLTVSSTMVGIFAIKDWILINLFQVDLPTFAGRVVSTFGQPNFYSGFLLFCLPFAFFVFDKYKNKFLILPLMILMGGIFISGSRSSIILSIPLLFLLNIYYFGFKRKFLMLGLLFFALILIPAKDYFINIYQKEFVEPTNTLWLSKNSPEKRIYIWPISISLILERPLLGYGQENLESAFSAYPMLSTLLVDRSHNYILDLLIFSGAAGLLSWILVVIMLIKKARGQVGLPAKMLLISLVTYLVWIQIQNQSAVHLIYFWLLAALIDPIVDKKG